MIGKKIAGEILQKLSMSNGTGRRVDKGVEVQGVGGSDLVLLCLLTGWGADRLIGGILSALRVN